MTERLVAHLVRLRAHLAQDGAMGVAAGGQQVTAGFPAASRTA
jgi:hypothetical protein